MKSIIKNIEAMAELEPDREALISASEEVSYAELNNKIQKISAYLSQQVAMKNKMFYTICSKESNALAAILATCLLDINNSVIPVDAHEFEKIKDVEFTNDVIVVSKGNFNIEHKSIVLTDKKFLSIDDSIQQINVQEIFAKEFEMKTSASSLKIKSDNSGQLVLYTSGTTGKSKGVVVSYRHFNFVNSSISQHLTSYNIVTRGSSVRPFLSTMLSTLKEGKTIMQIDVDKPEDIRKILHKNIAVESMITNIYGIKQLITIAENNKQLFENVQLVTITGGVVNRYLREMSDKIFPNAKVLDLYGQTELGLISVIDSTEWLENEYCVGYPSFFVEVVIKDLQTDQLLDEGRVGHIVVKSNHRFEEYTNYENVSSSDIYTGDLGYLKDGQLYLFGRISDCLFYEGAWLLKRDIECTLYQKFNEKFQVVSKDGKFYIISGKYYPLIEQIISEDFSSFRELIRVKIVEEICEHNKRTSVFQ